MKMPITSFFKRGFIRLFPTAAGERPVKSAFSYLYYARFPALYSRGGQTFRAQPETAASAARRASGGLPASPPKRIPPERGAAFQRVRGSGPLAGSRLLTPPCGSRGLRPRSPQRDIRRRLGRARVLLPAVAKPPLRGEFVRLSSQIASAPPGGVDFKLAAAR